MLQTVHDSELKRRSYSHFKQITPKCCEISLLLREFRSLFVQCYGIPPEATRYMPQAGTLRTSRWKPISQPCEFNLLLRKYFAALLSVWEISQTPFFSCEMVPGASRYLLPTLRDILHQIFCCLNPKILLVSHQLQDSLAFKLVKRENIHVIISFILCSYKYLSGACSQREETFCKVLENQVKFRSFVLPYLLTLYFFISYEVMHSLRNFPQRMSN